jgi:hypothetical protein
MDIRRLLAGPYPGLAVMLGSVLWASASNSLGASVLFAGGAFWSIATLWFENWRLKKR